ncbi:MAG: DUF4198 domain-containing protein [Verrucomicrobia bacterium]|nr:DUF4198 domain-containing protein [Cytophagales bacterium]
MKISESVKVYELKFTAEEVIAFYFHSQNAFIELEGDKFTQYLTEDGIQNMLQLRQARKEENKKACELYQRCAKTLVQVSNATDQKYKKVVGLPLEIIPLQNPYQLKTHEKLQVKILFKGKPLPKYSLRTWYKAQTSESTIENIL